MKVKNTNLNLLLKILAWCQMLNLSLLPFCSIHIQINLSFIEILYFIQIWNNIFLGIALGWVNKRAFLMVSIIKINFAKIIFSTKGQSIAYGISELGSHFIYHSALFYNVSSLKVLDWCDTKLTTVMNSPSWVSLVASQIFAANK